MRRESERLPMIVNRDGEKQHVGTQTYSDFSHAHHSGTSLSETDIVTVTWYVGGG